MFYLKSNNHFMKYFLHLLKNTLQFISNFFKANDITNNDTIL